MMTISWLIKARQSEEVERGGMKEEEEEKEKEEEEDNEWKGMTVFSAFSTRLTPVGPDRWNLVDLRDRTMFFFRNWFS